MYKTLLNCAKFSLSIALISIVTSCDRQDVAIGTREGETQSGKQSLPCQLANSIDKKSTDNSNVSGAIFVDASGSMGGYVNSNGSEYAGAINALDSIFDPKQTKYFSFDSTAKSISRDAFFESARQPSFYQGKDSKIDVALDSDQGRKSSLVVVVTDLEQDKGDVNRIVQKLATYVQKPNSAVGLIGIKSNFKGTVYNLNNSSFSYDKQRPFYMLAIGNEAEVSQLIGKIKTKFEKSAQTLIFRHQVPGDELAYLKVPGAKVEKLRGKLSQPQSLQQDIRIERGNQPIELFEIDKRAQEPLTGMTYELNFPTGEGATTPIIATNRVQITTAQSYDLKTKKMVENTTAAKALKFNLTQKDTTATANLTINPQDLPVGIYYMTADLPTSGITVPEGWKSWHQDINKSRNNDGSKTLGLVDFIDSLGSKVSEQQKTAGRLCFAIQRN